MCPDLISMELIAVDKENITKRNWFIDPLGKTHRIQWALIHWKRFNGR